MRGFSMKLRGRLAVPRRPDILVICYILYMTYAYDT